MAETAKRRGRRPKERDDETAEIVRYAAKAGHTHEKIARAVGLSDRTLRRLYSAELKRGTGEMILEVEAAHVKAALSGNVTAQIHILQTKGGWVNPNRVRRVATISRQDKQPAPQGPRFDCLVIKSAE